VAGCIPDLVPKAILWSNASYAYKSDGGRQHCRLTHSLFLENLKTQGKLRRLITHHLSLSSFLSLFLSFSFRPSLLIINKNLVQ